MRYFLKRPRTFWISVCNLVDLLFSMAGVVLLFYYTLPMALPNAPKALGTGYGGGPEYEAQKQRYDANANIGFLLVVIGTVLEAVPPFRTAIGSWRRRPSLAQRQTRGGDRRSTQKVVNYSARRGRPQVSTPPQTDINAERVSTETERVLHDFVRDAVSRLSEALNDVAHQSAPAFEDYIQFERGHDGNFRERKKQIRTLWPTLSPEWLHSLPDYEHCVDCLRSDEVIGPHLDCLVGTSRSTRRLEAESILTSLIYAILDDERRLTFTHEKFHSKWQELSGFFNADRIAYKSIAPLPNLVVPAFPLRLNDELVLDRLTDEEVTRCYQVGVIRPTSLRFPMIEGKTAVGIRRTAFLPKQLRRGDERLELPKGEEEGSFGRRPYFRDDLVIGDVLSALRLFKRTQIRTAGLASWTDAPWLAGGTEYRVLGQWPYGRGFELSEGEASQLLELWRLLEEEGGAARFRFSIHRFNLAFDRTLLDDRIVDLVIAAESLFLGDLGPGDRGEHRFRVALRAAKFIGHPSYSDREVFRVMRRAYDVRSAIVHGGSPEDTRLPDNQSADLGSFIDAVEDVVRLGLRKALSMRQDGKKIRQPDYWDALVFPNAAPTIEPSRSP